MNSLGCSSKWPSYDSLPSTSSFLLSESEQTEDEADIFSEGEDSGTRKCGSVGDRLSGLDFPTHPDHSRSKRDQSERCSDIGKHTDPSSPAGAATLLSSSATAGDLAFAQKCADLHRYIHPLLELLHGLKSGRFERGLTSFQQSVAIDRLQRILGVLQKPEMGEKYLHNVLQIEMLLKTWFPHVTVDAPKQSTAPRFTPHWRQNQLHIPVKKRKMSWLDPDHTTKHSNHQRGKSGGDGHVTPSLDTASACLPGSPKKQKIPAEETAEPTVDSCTIGHGFTDRTCSWSRPACLCGERESENQGQQHEISPPSPCGSLSTQDSSVSSSNTTTRSNSP
ncbi:circadian associated repressor of transcription a [Mugil cephalus]|uniref:circadian associated repressor of transcription a n=1 Tax=Mugil cephalus TaxID=48193 RepID=UPI001FB82124|nr:circadian associated repressor of transcription a [Mugil cephalus]